MTELTGDDGGSLRPFDPEYFDSVKLFTYNSTINPAPGGDNSVAIKFDNAVSRLLFAQRGNGGHVWTTMLDSWRIGSNQPIDVTWSDIGGSVRAGSSPSCESYNATYICLIQGPDERLYARVLPTSTKGL